GSQFRDRARVVVGEQVRVELQERLPRGTLDLDKPGEVAGAGGSDRHSGSVVHSDQETIPRSGRAGSSSIAGYSSGWPSGSRKYPAAAGIQPITLGSAVSIAWNESGVTPSERRRSHAPRTSSSEALNATCSESPTGAEPSDQSPSIAWPGAPIQKNAA